MFTVAGFNEPRRSSWFTDKTSAVLLCFISNHDYHEGHISCGGSGILEAQEYNIRIVIYEWCIASTTKRITTIGGRRYSSLPTCWSPSTATAASTYRNAWITWWCHWHENFTRCAKGTWMSFVHWMYFQFVLGCSVTNHANERGTSAKSSTRSASANHANSCTPGKSAILVIDFTGDCFLFIQLLAVFDFAAAFLQLFLPFWVLILFSKTSGRCLRL